MNWQHFARKSAVGRWLHLLMAVLVLTGSTGFGLVEHTCHIRQKTTVRLALGNDTAGHCCHAGAACESGQFKKARCCSETTHYENVAVSSSLTESVAKVGTLAVEALTQVFVYTAGVLVRAVLAFISPAPEQAAVPLAGRSLLAFVQVFRL